MGYQVKEIYYTLQGEGTHAGRPSVFCRFTGCNLWSGREEDRSKAICQFCDTDFRGIDGVRGGVFDNADQLAEAIDQCWQTESGEQWHARKMVVLTGGEPLLQLDSDALNAMHARDFYVAVETNGTIPAVEGIDWLCVSPKANSQCILAQGDELKLVFPQSGGDPVRYEKLGFNRFFLQPMDGPAVEQNTRMAIEYCKANPRWELSIQTHKLIGIP